MEFLAEVHCFKTILYFKKVFKQPNCNANDENHI